MPIGKQHIWKVATFDAIGKVPNIFKKFFLVETQQSLQKNYKELPCYLTLQFFKHAYNKGNLKSIEFSNESPKIPSVQNIYKNNIQGYFLTDTYLSFH